MKNMKKDSFLRGHFGPKGTGGTKMSANADLITLETYLQQCKGIENQFFMYGPKC